MFDACLYVDGDENYDEVESDCNCVSEYDEVCCECGETIPAGQPHDLYVGFLASEDRTDTYITCRTCERIWDSLSEDGKLFGCLDEMLYEAYGIGICDVPGEDSDSSDEDDMDAMFQRRRPQIVHYERKLLENTNGEERLSSALVLLEDFLTEKQIVQVYAWATAPSDKKASP